MSLKDVDLAALESVLSDPVLWRLELLALDNEFLIGVALAACACDMLPYWESHYSRDEQMEHLVSSMEAWVTNSTLAAQQHIARRLKQVALKSRGSLSPICPTAMGSDCPGDFAGDSIVAAANAITEIGRPDFPTRATECLEFAVEAISRVMAHRQPSDERADFWTLSHEHLRIKIAVQLQEWDATGKDCTSAD